jgi:hypothetical protein
MKIDIPAIPAKFDAVPIGDFFATKKDFGLCVSIDGTKKAAIILPETGAPRLQHGGLPYQVAHYPSAIVRIDLKSAVFMPDVDPPHTSLIKSANGSTYIRVSDGPGGDYRTFNAFTGIQEDLLNEPALAYIRWGVGLISRNEFVELLDWVAP